MEDKSYRQSIFHEQEESMRYVRPPLLSLCQRLALSSLLALCTILVAGPAFAQIGSAADSTVSGRSAAGENPSIQQTESSSLDDRRTISDAGCAVRIPTPEFQREFINLWRAIADLRPFHLSSLHTGRSRAGCGYRPGRKRTARVGSRRRRLCSPIRIGCGPALNRRDHSFRRRGG